MSNILFLDNGMYGKNNRYRYILTIGITFIGGTFASLFFIVLLIVIYSLILNINETSSFINILNNPLLFLIISWCELWNIFLTFLFVYTFYP